MTDGISLSELTGRIGATIRLHFGQPVWVRAEVNELRVNGGHCYMELVEKNPNTPTAWWPSAAPHAGPTPGAC